jgi:superfamily II DNA/RNA helicase
MFSATWPPEVKKIAAQYLTKPVKVCEIGMFG